MRRTSRRVRRVSVRGAHAPPAGGLGERRGGSSSARGAGRSPGGRPFPAHTDRELRGRAALGLPRAARVASRVACAARPLVMRAPPPACGWIEGGPRAERRNERREEEKSTTRAQNTDRELRGRSALGLPTRRARRGARRVRRAPACDARAPPPACGWIEGAPRAERRNERREEKSTTRATSLLDCGGENHPRRTRATRIARASPVAMHAGEDPFRTKRRPKRRRETRTTTGDRRREHHRATLLDCGGENHLHVRRAAPARLRERVSSPVAVAAAPREGSKKSLRACCHLKSGGRQTTDSKTTTPLPPCLHPYGEKTIRGSVARPTLHRPHERALAAESRGRLAGRIAGTYHPS